MTGRMTTSGGQHRFRALGVTAGEVKSVSGTFRRLLSYWRGEKWLLPLLLFCSLLSVCCALLCPYLLGRTVDDCIDMIRRDGSDASWNALSLHLVAFIALHLLSALFSWVHEYGMSVLAQRLLKALKEEMTRKLLSLGSRFYNDHLCGSVMSHFTNDAELVKSALGDTVVQLIVSFFTLVGSVIIMVKLSWQLALVTCLTVPFSILVSRFVMKRTHKYFTLHQESLGEMNGAVEESFGGIKTIKSFGREDERISQFEALNKAVCESGRKAQIYSGLLMPLMRVLDNCSYILVTVVGAFLASRGSVTVGVIQSFLLYTKNFQRPINTIAMQLNMVQAALAGAERIFRLLDEELEIGETDRPRSLEDVRGEVEFRNVSFGYGDELVLKNVSFSVSPGEVVAVVGSTGAGKTTLVNLLNRFYDVREGCVLVDGVDVREMPLADLRRAIGWVPQEAYLFSDTVKYNVAYGKSSASLAEVREALLLANADSLVCRMPDGYDTLMKEQGAGVSQGQRQLLTIARAVVKDAPILVLDEATSNIDTRTEMLIQGAISQIAQGRTCLIIAHRLSTIMNADKIIVLDAGKVAEEGKHDELLRKRGIYWMIYNSQFVEA